jgi:hypothetical protein
MAQLTVAEVQALQTKISALKSKRAKALEALKELFNYVTIDRGYTQTVIESSFNRFPWEDKTIGQTPAICVDDLHQELIRHAGTVREYKLYALVYAVCREVTLEQFEEFIADLEEAIEDNNSLFGFVNFAVVTHITTDAQYFSRLDGTRVAQLVVELNYTRHLRQPR